MQACPLEGQLPDQQNNFRPDRSCTEEEKKKKVFAVRRHNGSLCTQKQPETAALRALKAATRKSDPCTDAPAQMHTCPAQLLPPM